MAVPDLECVDAADVSMSVISETASDVTETCFSCEDDMVSVVYVLV